MGIFIKHPVSALSDKAFRQLDYQVMAMAFELYNSVGNLWNETDYKTKLLDRCIGNGLMRLRSRDMNHEIHESHEKRSMTNTRTLSCFSCVSWLKTFRQSELSMIRLGAKNGNKLERKELNASTYQQTDWINFDRNRIELHTLRKK